MKVRILPNTRDNPYGYFMIEAESEMERTLLANFVFAPQEEFELAMFGHGIVSGLHGVSNIAFGLRRKQK